MEGIVIIGYIAAIFIGLVVGLTGAGGSILALPILTYFFGVPVELATGYSLFVVGWVAAIVRHCPPSSSIVSYYSFCLRRFRDLTLCENN